MQRAGRKGRPKIERKHRLEVKSKADDGWYDGNISPLLVAADGEDTQEMRVVRTHFTGFKQEEDEFWGLEVIRSEGEIRKRVRLRSHQLQDEECGEVVEGKVVCAHYKSPDGVESRHHDAVVTQVSKAPHRKKIRGGETCHCSFTIKWQEGNVKGNYATLNCGEICLIVPEDVGDHPFVRKLLDFARNYSAKPESTPGSVFPHSSPSLGLEVSAEEKLEIARVQEREELEVEMSKVEGVRGQEGLEEEKLVEEVKEEQDRREEKIENIDIQEQEVSREEELKVDEVHVREVTFGIKYEQGQRTCTERPQIEEVKEESVREVTFGIKYEQAQRTCTEKPQIQEVREQEKGESVTKEPEEEKHAGEREVLMEEPEEEKHEAQKPVADVIELDWEEELLVEKLMEETNSHYRACDDEFLDLPIDIANHLRSFQMIHDCLAKETLELEKYLRKKS